MSDTCETCGSNLSPDTGWCPLTDADCDEKAGLRMERLRSTIRSRTDLYDAARKAIDTGDRRALAAYLSGLTPEELDRLGGFDDD